MFLKNKSMFIIFFKYSYIKFIDMLCSSGSVVKVEQEISTLLVTNHEGIHLYKN